MVTALTPGRAAYGPYKVGDVVRVTGIIVGVSSDDDWVNVNAFGAVFTVDDASVNPDLAHVPAQDARPAPNPAHGLLLALYGLANELDPDDDAAPRWGARKIAMKIRALATQALTLPETPGQ